MKTYIHQDLGITQDVHVLYDLPLKATTKTPMSLQELDAKYKMGLQHADLILVSSTSWTPDEGKEEFLFVM